MKVFCRAGIETQMQERMCGHRGWQRVGGANVETGMDGCALPCVKQIPGGKLFRAQELSSVPTVT